MTIKKLFTFNAHVRTKIFAKVEFGKVGPEK